MKSEIVLTDKSIDDMSVPDVSPIGYTGGGVRTFSKLIATFPDYGAILLVAPIRGTTEADDWIGMIGSIYALRGRTSAGNVTTKFEVAVSRAHTGVACLSTPWVSGVDYAMVAGVYRYQGVRYLGIIDNIVAGHIYIFDGIHSGNCCFQMVGNNEATKE